MPDMDGSVSPRVHVDGVEIYNADGERSRSPHPYHRWGPSLSQGRLGLESTLGSSPSVEVASCTVSQNTEATYFDTDYRKRRKACDVSGESGTEADDEKEIFLLGLPAPLAKPHKGLKGSTESRSPLLTPSYLDDEERRASLEAQTSRRASVHTKTTDTETAKLREKFRRRRRAEIIRRATETLLFLTLCLLLLQGNPQASLGTSCEDGHPPRLARVSKRIEQLPPSLTTFAATISALYSLYPVRIILRNHALSAAKHKSPFYIHIPAAFDPAPLLYPVLLPALVAWSIGSGSSHVLLPNLVLGLSSVPSKIIPWGGLGWYSSPQWIVSILPVLSLLLWEDRVLPQQANSCSADSKKFETLAFLFPLHQALLPILQYLTTTSLLVTELQLLSVSLINLLLLSESPQAIILGSVLWIGGLAMLVLCSKALRVGVAIARIPSWRFRKPRLSGRPRSVIIQATNDLLGATFWSWATTTRKNESSDNEEFLANRARARELNKKVPRIKTGGRDAEPLFGPLSKVPTMPISVKAADDVFAESLRNSLPKNPKSSGQRYRSTTLPTFLDNSRKATFGDELSRTDTDSTRFRRKWSVRSLTASQATVVRWSIALYVYVAIVGLILLPIKDYVSHYALSDAEPIGWALDYQFGDLAVFKSYVDRWNLYAWIPLHREGSPLTPSTQLGLAEVYRGLIGFGNTRLLICVYCLVVIALGLAMVLRLSTIAEVDTRRKVFHGMMVAMFLPTIFIDPTFIALAYIVVLAGFLILDLIRASQMPPLAKPLTYFLAPYVDGRDHRGPVVVSHIFLLIGCAIPLWLSLASFSRIGDPPWEGWEVPGRDLSMVSGIVCVGMGDAAASLIGRRYGRRRWCWTGGKSLEGSFAFATAVVVGLSTARLWLLIGGWAGDSGDSWALFWAKATCAGAGASLTEAVLTGGNDNVIVPVILWLLVKGLGM